MSLLMNRPSAKRKPMPPSGSFSLQASETPVVSRFQISRHSLLDLPVQQRPHDAREGAGVFSACAVALTAVHNEERNRVSFERENSAGIVRGQGYADRDLPFGEEVARNRAGAPDAAGEAA